MHEDWIRLKSFGSFFLWREEHQRTQRKPLDAKTRTNGKINTVTCIMQVLRFESRPHWAFLPLHHLCSPCSTLLCEGLLGILVYWGWGENSLMKMIGGLIANFKQRGNKILFCGWRLTIFDSDKDDCIKYHLLVNLLRVVINCITKWWLGA